MRRRGCCRDVFYKLSSPICLPRAGSVPTGWRPLSICGAASVSVVGCAVALPVYTRRCQPRPVPSPTCRPLLALLVRAAPPQLPLHRPCFRRVALSSRGCLAPSRLLLKARSSHGSGGGGDGAPRLTSHQRTAVKESSTGTTPPRRSPSPRMKPSFYAVAVGKARGIYSTWAQCSEQVTGYPGSVYKGFRTLAEARAFLASRPPVLAAAADTANGGADGKGGNNAGGRSDPSSPLAAHATPAATPAPSAMPTARGTCGGGSSGAAVKRPRSLIDVDVGDEDGGGASRVTPQPTRQRASAPLSPLPVTNSTASEGLGGAAGVQSVYVDGACSANGTALARAGYGGFYGSLTDSRNFACPVPLSERQTNNRGELRAVVHAIVQAFVDAGAATAEALKVTHSVDPTQWQLADLARPLPHLVIYTDSRYVIDGLTRFAKTWVANGFVLSTKKPVENQDLWRQLIRLRDHYNSLYAHQQHNALRRAEVGGAPPVRHTCANTNNDKSEGIELVHVRGHSNNVGNEMADSLAVSGSRKHGP